MPVSSSQPSAESRAGRSSCSWGVAALGHQVVVDTSDELAADAVATLFGAMIAPVGLDALARLIVERHGDRWTMGGAASASSFGGSLDDICWYLRYEVTRLLIAARADLVWLHAAGVARDGCAMLIAGTSGSGKSTLAARLVRRGLQYLGDEVLALDTASGAVHPFPMAPAVRAESSRDLSLSEVRRLPKSTVALASTDVAAGATRVAALAFPARTGHAIGVEQLPPSHAAIELLGHCLDGSPDRMRAVRAAAALAAVAPAIRLTFDEIDEAVACAERHLNAIRSR
jgi:hypothetical protein